MSLRLAFPLWASSRLPWLFAGLAAIDLTLIGLHVFEHHDLLDDRRFAITRERGFGEMFQYAKLSAAVALLVDISRRLRAITPAVWAAGFAAVLGADAFAGHERLGAALGPAMFHGDILGLAPNHAAELVVLTLGAACFVAAVASVSIKEGEAATRLSLVLGAVTAVIAGFGIGADAVHSMLRGSAWRPALAVAEDGGEMLSVSLLVSVLWLLWSQTRRP